MQTQPLGKKIFIVSKVYDTKKMLDEEITALVQADLDTLIGKDRVEFEINITETDIELTFRRGIDYSDDRLQKKLIIDADAYMICGIGLNGFKPPVMWYEPPFGYTYFFDQAEFEKCYKRSATKLGANRVKDLILDIRKDALVMKIR